ncbi:MAG: hypothetical protein LC640_01120 [Frankia sp.]|nr:hypothetical protein [Frankia sp.]
MKKVETLPKPRLDAARDTIAPVINTAVERTVPVLVSARDLALEKGAELLSSETAVEARRRGAEVLRAVKGELPQKKRRWPVALGFLALGTAVGAGISFVAQRLRTPVPDLEPYPAADALESTTTTGTPDTVSLTTDVSSNGSPSPVSGAAPSV